MLKDFNAVRISIASPEDILNSSHGEILRAETINYRTFKPEPGGLMAEEIFGPTKDFECYCGKYKKIRYKGIVCDRCGVEITHKRVRRERMGHITLACPVAHTWFSNGIPNRLALIIDIPQKKLETVIYYARYVITNVIEEERIKSLDELQEIKKKELNEIEEDLNSRVEELKGVMKEEADELSKEIKDKSKLSLRLEKSQNNERTQVAMLKSAHNQKLENIEKKFEDLKDLVEDIKTGSTLSEEEFQLLEGYNFYFYEAGMGAEAIKQLLDKLDIGSEIDKLSEEFKTSKSELKKTKIMQRLRILKGLRKSGVNPSWIILDVLPVIPPDIRPIVQLPGGRFATYDLNDLYRRVINRNNRLKRLIALSAPEIILRNEKRMLQESVDSLLDNNHKPGAPSLNSRGLPFKSLSDMLRGKQGRFRQNLLGKRVDYSGNAVIVSGPELKFHQCGIPKNVALELFRPFIIRELIAQGFVANPAKAKIQFESKASEVWDILEQVSKDRPVLLNRAPTLHRQSIIAFYPLLVEGNAIRLHPMTVKGFNADFDGDQMAVYLPLSDEAVEEVKERMFIRENMLSLRDGSPIVNVSKDMAMGIYFMTKLRGDEKDVSKFYSNMEDLLTDHYLNKISFDTPINNEVIVSSAGRAMFNKILPADYGYINRVLNMSDISKISADIFNKYGKEIAVDVLDNIKALGFKYAGKLGISISMDEFEFGAEDIVKQRLTEFEEKEEKLMKEYKEGMITNEEFKWIKREEWVNSAESLQNEVWSVAKKNALNLIDLDISGATTVGAWVKKISGVGGYVVDPNGNIVDLPIKNNYKKGFSSFEYFVAARGARKSFADVALRTADSGYLARRLHDVAQDIVVNSEDCLTKDGVEVMRDAVRSQSFINRIKGRVTLEPVINPTTNEVLLKKNEAIELEMAKRIDETKEIISVKVRSPITCKIPHGMCRICYGFDLGTGKLIEIGEAVGTIASQALGEPTTQLTLKSKSDARAAKSDITQGLPRVEELLEARTPKAISLLADINGKVQIIDEKKKVLIRVSGLKKIVKKYILSETDNVRIKDGAKVDIGDVVAVIGKKEIKAEVKGTITIEGKVLTIQGQKNVEIEKETEAMINLVVKDGDIVQKGDQLTFGSIDPKELAKLKDIHTAQKYIIDEVQAVYGIQGLEVDDRHLEIVVRQMGRYGLVSEGDETSEYLPGDFSDILDLDIRNMNLEKEGKPIIKYKRVLLGVTNAALRTESFLSAASFEQQVRVLTDAALIGKVDNLRGLKENVIIGRLVPLGHVLKNKMREDELKAEALENVGKDIPKVANVEEVTV